MEEKTPYLEIYDYGEKGYMPLVFTPGWQVALLNWMPLYDLENASEIEVHTETDEVFILWKGHGALFVETDQGLRLEDMQPGVIYNVPKGSWHGVIATRDVSWIIVEDRDTHLHDTTIRSLTEAEKRTLREKAPGWAKD